jgi:hypothetical protein
MAVIKKNSNFFFPSPRNKRYYYPSTVSTFATPQFLTITTNINYMPIYINKYIENPNFCIDVTAGSTATVQVGIYDGKNGLSRAPLLWSGNIVVSSIGIIKISSNIKLKEGWYILGSTITSLSSLTVRVPATNMFRVLFGERTDVSIGSAAASSHFSEANAGGLLSTISTFSSGNIIQLTNPSAPLVVLEY